MDGQIPVLSRLTNLSSASRPDLHYTNCSLPAPVSSLRRSSVHHWFVDQLRGAIFTRSQQDVQDGGDRSRCALPIRFSDIRAMEIVSPMTKSTRDRFHDASRDRLCSSRERTGSIPRTDIKAQAKRFIEGDRSVNVTTMRTERSRWSRLPLQAAMRNQPDI